MLFRSLYPVDVPPEEDVIVTYENGADGADGADGPDSADGAGESEADGGSAVETRDGAGSGGLGALATKP